MARLWWNDSSHGLNGGIVRVMKLCIASPGTVTINTRDRVATCFSLAVLQLSDMTDGVYPGVSTLFPRYISLTSYQVSFTHFQNRHSV